MQTLSHLTAQKAVSILPPTYTRANANNTVWIQNQREVRVLVVYKPKDQSF